MTAAVRAELRKVSTTRLWQVMGLCVVVLSGAYALLPAATSLIDATGDPFARAEDVWAVYNGGNALGRVLALVVGVGIVGVEYRYRTVLNTYMAVPRRSRVMAAKVVAGLLFGQLFGVLSVAAGVVVATPFLLSQDSSFFLGQGATWRSLGLGVVSLMLWTLIGMGIAMAVHGMVLALVIGIGFSYLVDPGLNALFFLKDWSTAANLLPSGATNAMLGIDNSTMLASDRPWSWWAGLLVLVAWSTVPLALGLVITLRRDPP